MTRIEKIRVYLRSLWGWIPATVKAAKIIIGGTVFRWRLFFTEIAIHEKCPSCGHRNGVIKFSRAHGCLIHSCQICNAEWGEKCIVKPEDWMLKLAEEQTDGPGVTTEK